MGRGAKRGKAQVEARRSVARKPLKNEGSRVRDLEKRLAEALEQQTATSEILRVISSSPTDVQPVFSAIVESAVRLCGARFGAAFRFDGELVHLAAQNNLTPENLQILQRLYPMRPSRDQGSGRAILAGVTVQIQDALADPEYRHEVATAGGWRSMLSVPMLREGSAVGTINVHRTEAGPFHERQIELLKTFADQAVIAIENVRLFKELEGRNRDLTATSEILRVISQSPTDVQPVFSAIADSAAHLTGAVLASVYEFDGSLIHLRVLAPADWPHGDDLRHNFPRAPAPDFAAGRVIIERAVLQGADLWNDPDTPELTRAWARRMNLRSVLWVPMFRKGEPIGVIGVTRRESGFFPDEQVRLLQTFADQAVIAIENVRLFTELQEKNQALTEAHAQVTEALEQQTATSEVLKVISRSTFELEPVLETLIENATRLCGADRGQVYKADGEVLRSATAYGLAPEVGDYLKQRPLPIGPSSMAGRAALERRTIHSSDVLAEAWFQPPDDRHKILGLRTVLAVPMLRGETVVGVFTIWKTIVEPFTDRQIELVTTFADQAVIAIENVRLFKEVEARTRELTHSVEELRALGEVSQAVSSTLELETVLATIVSRAVQMSGSYEGIVYEFDEATQTFHARATHQITPEHLEALRRTPVRLGEGAVGRAGVIHEPVQVADIEAEWQLVAPQVRTLHAREGMRSLLAVPLVREDRLFGGLVILRRDRGAFPPEAVATLQTLAAQSVLAIQNARLFREIADKSAQLEHAAECHHRILGNSGREDVR